MNTLGQRQRQTQVRVIKLCHRELGYEYLGKWIDRARENGKGNCNIEEGLLGDWLARRGYSENLISRALHQLGKGEGRPLYDANRAVYDLLR